MARPAAQRDHRRSPRGWSRILPIHGALGLLVAAVIAWAGSRIQAVATDSEAPGRLVAAQPVVDLGRVALPTSPVRADLRAVLSSSWTMPADE